jgi:hypothetical protein
VAVVTRGAAVGTRVGIETVCRRGTDHNERKRATRVDCDVARVFELGAGAIAIAEASSTAAGERGGRPSGEVDTADAVVAELLQCIRGAQQHTLSEESIDGLGDPS